jgi:hypothetical protein
MFNKNSFIEVKLLWETKSDISCKVITETVKCGIIFKRYLHEVHKMSAYWKDGIRSCVSSHTNKRISIKFGIKSRH